MPTQEQTRYTETLKDGTRFEMIQIEGGPYQMGNAEKDASDEEKPVHRVTVPSFSCGKYLVTQELWKAVMGENPSHFQGKDRPVDSVSWEDVQDFLAKLRAETGKPYRLPTEAEWEFAARGGIHSEGYLYAGSDKLSQVGWYGENSPDGAQPVGLKLPNELGLYDMSGNLWEWCEDDWHNTYHRAPQDGSAWIDWEDTRTFLGKLFNKAKEPLQTASTKSRKGSFRVLRGGYWYDDARLCGVSFRFFNRPEGRYPNVGFRLACSLQSVGKPSASP